MSKRFSELPAADVPLVGNEKFAVTQGGASKKTTAEAVRSFSLNRDIVNITSAGSLNLFETVYSLQGSNSYTVTIPAPSAANTGKKIFIYKEGNSSLGNKVTVESPAPIKANSTEYTSLSFRFQGESLVLVSHFDHWDVISAPNLFSTAVSASDETSFVNSIAKMLDLGKGGIISITGPILLTQNLTVDLTGIRVFADSSVGTSISMGGHVLTITGSGFYFDGVRFVGELDLTNSPGVTGNQHFMSLVVDNKTAVHSGTFENCTFRNLVGTTEGSNIEVYKEDTDSFGYNITFNCCDIITTSPASTEFVGITIKITNPNNITPAMNFLNLLTFDHKRFEKGFDRIRMVGEQVNNNNSIHISDGSMYADVTPADNALGSTILGKNHSLISYLEEKSNVENEDDLLIHDKDSDELRRIPFSDLLAPAVQTNIQKQIDRVVRIPITTITSGTTLSLDFAVTNNFEITLSHNATLAAPSNVGVGQCGRILVRQDATGSRTLAYNTIWKFVDGEAPVLTTDANALDLLVYEVLSETEILLQLLSDIK